MLHSSDTYITTPVSCLVFTPILNIMSIKLHPVFTINSNFKYNKSLFTLRVFPLKTVAMRQ